jgi:hypothetical protein
MKKWAEEMNRAFFQRKKTHEKMINIPGYKGNANQNHIKVPTHFC